MSAGERDQILTLIRQLDHMKDTLTQALRRGMAFGVPMDPPLREILKTNIRELQKMQDLLEEELEDS